MPYNLARRPGMPLNLAKCLVMPYNLPVGGQYWCESAFISSYGLVIMVLEPQPSLPFICGPLW